MKTNTETVTSGITQTKPSIANVRATALAAKGIDLMGPAMKSLSVDDYLRGQQQQQAIRELPRWMPQIEADIAQLRHRYDNLVSVMAVLVAITLSALVLLMGSLIIF
ncbi:MAG: hypothetical protein Q4P13_12865 [Psychrobacter sp.]|nr:hypothetical protein [Psychrobacter sp.]